MTVYNFTPHIITLCGVSGKILIQYTPHWMYTDEKEKPKGIGLRVSEKIEIQKPLVLSGLDFPIVKSLFGELDYQFPKGVTEVFTSSDVLIEKLTLPLFQKGDIVIVSEIVYDAARNEFPKEVFVVMPDTGSTVIRRKGLVEGVIRFRYKKELLW